MCVNFVSSLSLFSILALLLASIAETSSRQYQGHFLWLLNLKTVKTLLFSFLFLVKKREGQT